MLFYYKNYRYFVLMTKKKYFLYYFVKNTQEMVKKAGIVV